MKSDIHPEYRPVVFQDTSANYSFLTRSTIRTNKTIVWEDGNEYPLVTVEISSASHPFYTGEQRIVDTAGQVDRFMRRLQTAQSKQAASQQRRQTKQEEPKKPSLYQEVFGEEAQNNEEQAAE
jgi:large subunit ribosomal protein L31